MSDSDKLHRVRALLDVAPVMRYDNGYPVRAVPKADLLSVLAGEGGDTVLNGLLKILERQACIEGWDGERVCEHRDHGNYMWPEGNEFCNGAPEILTELRALVGER